MQNIFTKKKLESVRHLSFFVFNFMAVFETRTTPSPCTDSYVWGVSNYPPLLRAFLRLLLLGPRFGRQSRRIEPEIEDDRRCCPDESFSPMPAYSRTRTARD